MERREELRRVSHLTEKPEDSVVLKIRSVLEKNPVSYTHLTLPTILLV